MFNWTILFAILLIFSNFGKSRLTGAAEATTGEASPQRIVSLKPNITEILFAIGAGDRIVGVTTWCNFPPEAAALPKVADYIAPNVEKVLALQPDLVIGAQENSWRQSIDRLKSAGISVLLTSFDSIDTSFDSIRTIGEAVGAPTAAAALALRLKLAMDALTRTWQHAPTPRALVVVGHWPLVAAGPQSFIGALVAQAGGANIVTTRETAYPRPAMEMVLAKDPEVIIDLTSGMGESAVQWESTFPAVKAVQTGRIVTLPTDLFRPGPRLAHALQTLGCALHRGCLTP
ncbi:MAG: ABC transporter substrate-binding protein [Deltaproteobacteria bacterium]|nr:ABC transporter substrate-binding protein [Deltaproteobacteria bacterium]